MTTLVPRGPYNAEELKQLYPEQLQLQQVQIAGMPAFWPFCNAAKRMTNSVMRDREASEWTDLKWRRRLESFGHNDRPEVARGPKGEVDGVCNLGELTDTGRETTLALGQRLRHLYVEQLGFMPKTITSADSFYLRATPMARALESLQQSFEGMYPLNARIGAFPPMTIITRPPSDETLFPNESNCRRFSQLSRAFGQRAADKWNNTSDMDYLNKLLSKWMPEDSKRVAVDSHPRLSGIMDTTNSSLAHSSEVHLPKEFYDAKGRGIMEKIGVDEWFSGFQEMEEYRKVGIGSLVGDLVTRMVGYVEKSPHDGIAEVGGQTGELGDGRHGETSIRFVSESFKERDGHHIPATLLLSSSKARVNLLRRVRLRLRQARPD
ncbi:hypothetical protein MMC25_003957 [Agyrium rufum]|nr:hypothetical protein [Agyrium rufum]